jgi:site-specific recombinase XerD
MKNRKAIAFATFKSVRLPIYHRPVKVKLGNPANSQSTNAASSPLEEPIKIYDSYQIAFYEAGKWRSVRASTLEKAKTKGNRIARRLAENGAAVDELSLADRRIYVLAKKTLQPCNLEVDSAARLVAELLDRLNGISLQRAVDFFISHGRHIAPNATTAEVYSSYLEHLERRGAGNHHFRDVRKFIGAFVEEFPGQISSIKTHMVDAWLTALGGRARNKNNARGKLISFFNFAVEKSYLIDEDPHAAKAATAFTDPRPIITTEAEAIANAQPKEIYLPEEMAKLLNIAQPEVRITLELKAFSGIRTEELVRLWWVLINEEAGYINIPAAVAKLKQRAVPICENLKRRLAAYPTDDKRERVSKQWSTANSLYHAWKRTADRAGLPYRNNAFRRSYISYRLAETKDINLVAHESGNSAEMIRKYYMDLVTPEQAKAWFSL